MKGGTVALALLLAACGGSPPPGDEASASPAPAPDPAWTFDQARVVFAARRGEARELFVLDRASGEVRRLTDVGPEAGANAPRVSPDGRRLAFQLSRGQDYEVYTMDLAGGTMDNLTEHPGFDGSPAWSPDGRRIAFMSNRGLEPGELGPFPGHIYEQDLESRALDRVTERPMSSSFGPSDWSPDGRSLLLARDGEAGIDVVELTLDSRRERRLTASSAAEYSAVYSPDGQRIAFHADGEKASQIVVAGLESGETRPVTSGPGFRYYPRWSPDGRWILYTASADGQQYDLEAVRVADGEVVVLVATPEDEREGEWLPAGAPLPR